MEHLQQDANSAKRCTLIFTLPRWGHLPTTVSLSVYPNTKITRLFSRFVLLTSIIIAIGGPSSKFDEFLAARSQFNSDNGVDFSTPTSCQSATYVRPLFAFYCTFFLRKQIINNAAFRHRRGDVSAARMIDLRNRSIALRERWYHRSTADDQSLHGDTVDGATVMGRVPALIQPVDTRVPY